MRATASPGTTLPMININTTAASALRIAGSGPIGVVSLGRHFAIPLDQPHRQVNEKYLQESRSIGWSWDTCCLCA
jgi:hypothetical protein